MYFWIVPAACGVVAVVAILANGPALLREKNALEKHRERLETLGSGFDASRVERAIERTRTDIEAMQPLVERAKVAVVELQGAVKMLGMKRAKTAATLATLSIRALLLTLRARV